MRTRTRRRLRSLRTIALIIGLPIISLLVLRLIWGWQSNRRATALRDDLRRQGIHLELSDFPEATGPEADRAIAVHHAVMAMSFSDPELELLNGTSSEPSTAFADLTRSPEERKELARLWNANSQLAGMLDTAPPDAPISRDLIKSSFARDWKWKNYRIAARLLFEAAVDAHEHGADLESFRHVKRIATLARVMHQCPSVIGCMFRNDVRFTAAECIERLSPRWDLLDPRTRSEARSLLLVLNDSSAVVANTFTLETDAIEMRQYIQQGHSFFQRPWIYPLFQDNLRRLHQDWAGYLPATQATNWPDAARRLRHATESVWPPNDQTELDQRIRSMEYEALNDYSNVMVAEFKGDALTNAARVLLASHLYAAEAGKLPRDMQTLVPTYLDSVPTDPFSQNEAPLHYRLDADGATVWSVWLNGQDDGGLVSFDPAGVRLPRAGYKSNKQSDLILGAAWRRASSPAGTAPSTEGFTAPSTAPPEANTPTPISP